jgi:NADPH-dependent 2,4-dienoyl-CoA reductase/sulfur reductase-like enzyme
MSDTRVVVVGAGPAGMRACAALVAAGLTPILIDEAARPGGRIYQQPPQGAARPGRELYGFEAAKAARIHALEAQLAGRIDHRRETLVWNCFEDALDLLGPSGPSRQPFDALILATGATDLALPFPGWTLPGVYALGGAQIALKTQGCGIGRRVVFLGAGPLLPLVAWQYVQAGADVVAVLDGLGRGRAARRGRRPRGARAFRDRRRRRARRRVRRAGRVLRVAQRDAARRSRRLRFRVRSAHAPIRACTRRGGADLAALRLCRG